MKRKIFALVAGVSIVLMSIAPAALSQEGFIIQEEVVGPNVRYMSGGVGLEERRAMEKQAATGYDLKLEFAITPGNYVSYVDVKINDQAGRSVIDTQANGPWFYADLPRGTYTVVANYQGREKSQRVTVNEDLQHVIIHFTPEEPAQAGLERETRAGTATVGGPGEGADARPGEPGRPEQAK